MSGRDGGTGEHVPRCNDLCRGDSHHLCGDDCPATPDAGDASDGT